MANAEPLGPLTACADYWYDCHSYVGETAVAAEAPCEPAMTQPQSEFGKQKQATIGQLQPARWESSERRP